MRSIAAALLPLAMAAALFPAQAQMQRPAPAAEGGASLAGRLERLEEQVADLQGVITAVETLARNNSAGTGYAAAAGGGVSGEQVRQLSEQIADLTQRLERLEARLGEGAAAGQRVQPRQDLGYGTAPAGGFEDKQQLPPVGAAPAERSSARPQQGPAAGQLGYDAAGAAPRSGTGSGAVSASAASSGRALFDQAYGALNRREYSAAETYFQQFLDQYPADALAGSAQFWLGETAFVSGEYKTAADRFLKTFTNYPTNERAPEALLKLAISLRRLGNNTDACATFVELERRYPQAPKTVLQRADAEKKRASCS